MGRVEFFGIKTYPWYVFWSVVLFGFALLLTGSIIDITNNNHTVAKWFTLIGFIFVMIGLFLSFFAMVVPWARAYDELEERSKQNPEAWRDFVAATDH